MPDHRADPRVNLRADHRANPKANHQSNYHTWKSEKAPFLNTSGTEEQTKNNRHPNRMQTRAFDKFFRI